MRAQKITKRNGYWVIPEQVIPTQYVPERTLAPITEDMQDLYGEINGRTRTE
jgi:hypothetical protein